MNNQKDRLQFYTDLKSHFPEIAQSEFWKENLYLSEPSESTGVMTKLGELVIQWAQNCETDKIQKLLDFFELSYQTFRDEITCYIYTDFLPTLITMNDSKLRESIKTMFQPELMKNYKQLIELGFYREF